MCGIAGAFGYRPEAPSVDPAELTRVRDRMAMRGPDGSGLWVASDGRVGLAHRRLAIIDLSEAASQPMASADGRLRVVFNGEIYNYRQLRAQLAARGHQFRTSSDTEVLLALYSESGEDMVKALRGMFAFAIWDERLRSLLLARDPLGIKPLYYADDGRTVRFASQVKALLAGGRLSTAPSPAGVVGFHLWGHIPDPHTLYREIAALPAGHTLRFVDGGRSELKRYFDIVETFATAEATRVPPAEWDERLGAAVRDSVSNHLVADVPVGIFQSAGIDSSTLTAVSSRLGQEKLNTVTLGFKEYRGTENDETLLAEAVAKHYGARHETHWISREDFEAELPQILDVMDQPSIDGVNTYFVCRAAARSGMKVALSGIGSDEIFGGYPSFRELPRLAGGLAFARWIPGLGKAARVLSAPFLSRMTSPKWASLLEYGPTVAGAYLLRRGLFMPWELTDVLDEALLNAGLEELQTQARLNETVLHIKPNFHKVSALELTWYMRNQLLRDTDWASMAHSVEVRVPFADADFLRNVLPLTATGQIDKPRMARAAAPDLPRSVLDRRKTGFSIPVREWAIEVAPKAVASRGMRDWARRVFPLNRGRRILMLATDAFGGRGGIAKFNRDLIRALCAHPACDEIVVIPRLMPNEPGEIPRNLRHLTNAVGSKVKYAFSVIKVARSREVYNLIICGHIHLIPLAWLASRLARAPFILIVHGIDAWQPTRNALTNWLVRRLDGFVSVSDVTKGRFVAWSRLDPDKGRLLPNSVDLERFTPRPKNPELVARYGLGGRPVIMTMGRLVSAERYKGFDEVLEQLPGLIETVPNLAYLIVGEGSDRARLERKAKTLKMERHVVFTGFVSEESKSDHYNLADAFIMPSRGEGFGIVFLEAMACGLPVVGSLADGSREALRDGMLGMLVDPDDPGAIQGAILKALKESKHVPTGLDYFGEDNFRRRVHDIIDQWPNAA